ncbi:MAG: helix-turn-helix domain-containing protein [Gammaproteobacteria bacterium]
MNYKHLSLEERHYIELSMKNEITPTAIASALDRSQSTIYREVERNKGLKGYRHKQADRLAKERHETKPKAIKLTDEIKELIQAVLIRTGVLNRWQADLKRKASSSCT